MSVNPARPGRAWASIDVVVAGLYALAIFVVGSLPATPAVARDMSDKLQHAVGFALLAWLMCRALRRLGSNWALPRLMVYGALLSIALGGALELWQGLLAYRSCELLDWVADALGSAIGVAIHAGLVVVLGRRPRAAQ
jgi:VanZ family protein